MLGGQYKTGDVLPTRPRRLSHLGGAYYGLVRQKKSREVTFSLVAFLRSSYGINEMKTEASSHL